MPPPGEALDEAPFLSPDTARGSHGGVHGSLSDAPKLRSLLQGRGYRQKDEWEGLKMEEQFRRMRAWIHRKCTLRCGGEISGPYRGIVRMRRLPRKHQKENARISIHERLKCTSFQSPKSLALKHKSDPMLEERVTQAQEVSESAKLAVLRSHEISTAGSVKSPLRCCHQHCSTEAQSA